MSHQPFPKKGANLIKNTDSLKDSQVTYGTPSSEHSAGRSASCTQAARTDTPSPAAESSLFGIKYRHLQAQHPGSLQGYKSSWADRATTEGRGNAGGIGRKTEADLGYGNKPTADTGST